MERRDFLTKIGMGAAAVLTIGCFNACSKDDSPATDVDFTVDLSNPANAALQTNGGFVITNDIVVAKTIDGDFAAATVICSHAQNRRVRYESGANEWQCDVHGARFRLDGTGLNSTGSRGLRTYQTELLDPNTLRVFS
jgi:cytochrome b6-f complex iron-sulfur subunit